MRMSSSKAMKIAEKLYTSGYISYPRTETNSFGNKTNLQEILDKLKENPDYSDYLERMGFMRPRSGKNNDQAHPPIHPVKNYVGDRNSDEFKVFDFIARRFMACCSEDAIIEDNEVQIQINEERFRAKGILIKAKKFLEIYEKFYTLKQKALPVFV